MSSPFATRGTATRVLRPPRASSGPSSARPSVGRALPGSGSLALRSSSSLDGSRRYTWHARAASRGRVPATTVWSSSSSASERAIASASSVSCSSSETRRRASSYSRAFSIAPATSDADVTRKSTSLSENSRGASVCAVITPMTSAGAADDGDREQRLELLLLELGEVLRARVGEGVVADERGLAALRRPPGEPLAALHDDLPRLPLVRRRGRAQDEPLAALVDEIREAGVDAARLGHEPDDRAQDLGQFERGRDRGDDLVEDLLAALQPHWHWIVRQTDPPRPASASRPRRRGARARPSRGSRRSARRRSGSRRRS